MQVSNQKDRRHLPAQAWNSVTAPPSDSGTYSYDYAYSRYSTLLKQPSIISGDFSQYLHFQSDISEPWLWLLAGRNFVPNDESTNTHSINKLIQTCSLGGFRAAWRWLPPAVGGKGNIWTSKHPVRTTAFTSSIGLCSRLG